MWDVVGTQYFLSTIFLLLDYYSVLFYFLVAPCGLWDLSFLTRDRTRAMAMKVWNPNHQATREPPRLLLLQALNSKGPPVFVPGMEHITCHKPEGMSKKCTVVSRRHLEDPGLSWTGSLTPPGPPPWLFQLNQVSSPLTPVHFCHACHPFQDDLCASPAPSVDCLLPGGRTCSTHF